MHLYSNNVSARTIISSLSISELFAACSSCGNKFIPSQSLSGLEDINFVENLGDLIL